MSKLRIDTPQKREIVTKMVRTHPEMSSLMMARVLFRDYPEFWKSVELARDSIRKRRGASGDTNRRLCNNMHGATYQDRTGFKWQMPKSISEPWEPFPLPQGVTLCLSDVHVPYHDDVALEAALRHGDGLNGGGGPDTVLLNGDVADFFSISRFEQDPRQRNLAAEVTALRHFLGCLRGRFPRAGLIYKLGNHDERWERRLWEKAPEYLDLPQMQVEAILTGPLQATDKIEAQPAIEGVRFVKDQRFIMAGKLAILHGHEFPRGMSSPVNPARGQFMRGIECSLAGHLHRTSEHVEPTMFGRVISCWSQGCLCGLTPPYCRISKWNHGFAVVTLKDELFEVNNLRIIRGKVYG